MIDSSDIDRRKCLLAMALVASDHLLEEVMADTNSSESDADFDPTSCEMRVRQRGPRRKLPRVEGSVSNMVPMMNTKVFREHFRMTPTTFESLEVRLSPEIFVINDTGRRMVPARTQLLSVLWLLATPDSYRSVADRFGMGKNVRVTWLYS